MTLFAIFGRIRGNGQGSFWTREVIFLTSLIPAGLGFVLNLLLVKVYGVERFGQWSVWKSASQLTATLSPGFASSLMYILVQNEGNPSRQEAYHHQILRLCFGWFLIASAMALVFVYHNLNEEMLVKFGILLFWASSHLDGIGGALARGYKNGIALLHASLIELVITLILLLLIFFLPFSWFVLLSGIKFLCRTWVQFAQNRADIKTASIQLPLFVAAKESIEIGFPILVRGWVQAAFQYGDKLLIGLFFGNVAAGVVNLGSLFALPVVMLSSATAVWLLPILLQEDRKGKELVYAQVRNVLAISLALEVYLFVLPLFIPSSMQDMSIIVLAYSQTTLLSIFTIFFTVLASRGQLWLNVKANLVICLSILAIFYLSKQNDLGLLKSFTLSNLFVFCAVFFTKIKLREFTVRQNRFLSKLLMAHVVQQVGLVVLCEYELVTKYSSIIILLGATALYCLIGFYFKEFFMSRISGILSRLWSKT